MDVRHDVAQESTFGRMINYGSAYHQGSANSGIAEELEASKAAVGLENILGNNDCGGFVTSDNVDEFVFLNLGVV